MTSFSNEIEFDLPIRKRGVVYNWHCWLNDITGVWGAILSRKGEDGKKRKEELYEAIRYTKV